MRPYFKSGCWNANCDVCGFTFKSDELRPRWDGLMVCRNDWEPRHPQDLIKIPKDDPSVPWARTEDLSAYFSCSFGNSMAISGTAVAGCARAGRVTPIG